MDFRDLEQNCDKVNYHSASALPKKCNRRNFTFKRFSYPMLMVNNEDQ